MQGARFKRVMLHRGDLRTRFPRRFRARLEGCRVDELTRRAKYLLAHLSSGETLLMHLGMSGSFRVEYAGQAGEPPDAGRHDHVVFTMSSHAEVLFNDPRRFGFMDVVPAGKLETYPSLSRLGPEPLAPAFDGAVLAAACRGKKVSLKVALMDQRGRCRPRQHLRERGAARRAAVTAPAGVDNRHGNGRAPRRRAPARRGYQAGARRGDRADHRRDLSRLEVSRVRPRRRALPPARL